MRRIIYYVATSLDGYISGPENDISGFIQQGKGVEQYFHDLQAFDSVIMGRKTYEFGYQWGIQPGQPAYPNMKHHIFSNSLTFDNPHELVQVRTLDCKHIEQLKSSPGTDIYLAGGGELAGWLLDNQYLDILKIKLNPLVLGAGTRMFGSSTKTVKLALTHHQQYEDGLQIRTYAIHY